MLHSSSSLQSLIEQNATALGFEVVEVERAPLGLLRVLIDRPQGEGAVTVGDCGQLSDQLTHVFEVEGIDYARLEVSSPGVDRPLVKPADYVRFAGAEITLKLRTMVAGQRKFEGVLQAPEGEDFAIEFETPTGRSLLRFKVADVERARLVPKLDFKRKTR